LNEAEAAALPKVANKIVNTVHQEVMFGSSFGITETIMQKKAAEAMNKIRSFLREYLLLRKHSV
jgi:hypothetical protein